MKPAVGVRSARPPVSALPAPPREVSRSTRRAAVVVVAAATVIALVPVDFVALTEMWRLAGLASLVVGSVAALWALARVETSIVRPALVFATLIIAFNQFAFFNPVGFLSLLAPVIVGVGAAVAVRSPLHLLIALSLVIAVTLGVEYVVQQHIFAALFGVENYIPYANNAFRPRGIIGQAVPAAMMAVGVGAAVFMLSRDTSVRWCLGVATAVSVIASGTRSALICSLILLILVLLAALVRNRHERTAAIGGRAAWAGPLLVAGLALAVASYWTVLSTQRIFSFGALSGSESNENRDHAASVLDTWSGTCRGTCLALGNGARNLLITLGNGLGFHGFTTVDNLYVSALWDFGVPLVVGFAVLTVVALRVLFVNSSPVNRAGAMLVLSVMASGFFYDALYIRPVLLLFGCGIGLLGLRRVSV